MPEEEGGRKRSADVPEDFLEIRKGRVIVWVRNGFSFLFDERGNWLKARPFCKKEPDTPRKGRGDLKRMSLGVKGEPFGLIRHYQRGGFIRHLLRDLYWGKERFFSEVRVADRALRGGVPTAEVLALRTEGAGWGFCRADLMTREIENSLDLDGYLRSARPGGFDKALPAKKKVTLSVAALLRQMHKTGLFHADLNLKNILLRFSMNELKTYVIDLDRARIEVPLTKQKRVRNLTRLYRSLEKYGHTETVVTNRDCLRFIRVYCRGEKEMEISLKRMMRKSTFSLRMHRFFWKISGRRKKS